jgi:uncharacterized protein YecA (UPF0149 family)
MTKIIDNIHDSLKKLKAGKVTSRKIQRNDPCYCGSKLKFKNCHLKTHN